MWCVVGLQRCARGCFHKFGASWGLPSLLLFVAHLCTHALSPLPPHMSSLHKHIPTTKNNNTQGSEARAQVISHHGDPFSMQAAVAAAAAQQARGGRGGGGRASMQQQMQAAAAAAAQAQHAAQQQQPMMQPQGGLMGGLMHQQLAAAAACSSMGMPAALQPYHQLQALQAAAAASMGLPSPGAMAAAAAGGGGIGAGGALAGLGAAAGSGADMLMGADSGAATALAQLAPRYVVVVVGGCGWDTDTAMSQGGHTRTIRLG